MKFLKKHWKNILFWALILVLLMPVTRKPIQVFVHGLIATSPKETPIDNQKQLVDYNWTLKRLHGNQLNFNQSKGKITIVNFWATWCPPCIAEMPSFQNLYNDYQGKVDFYFVANDKVAAIDTFFKKKDLSLPVYFQETTSPKLLDGFSLPTTYILDKKGNIIVEKTGAAEWDSDKTRAMIDGLLEE